MILRFWRGWTRPEHADDYATLLSDVIFPEILSRGIDGLIDVQMMRRDETGEDGEVEFATIMRFDRLESVKNFMGENLSLIHI